MRRLTRWTSCALMLAAMSATAQAGPVAGGLVLDLEAGVGVVTDGSGNVVSWADQSGQGHNASQGSAGARPTFVSNGLNGGPTLAFNGSNQYLNVYGQVLSSQQFTIMALVTDASQSGGYREIFSNWSPTTFTQSVFLGHTGQTAVRFTDSYDNVGSVSNPTAPSVLTGESFATDAAVYQDTTLLADKGSALSHRDLTDQYRIGTQGAQFEYWNGNIAAILVYDRALTDAERNQNVAYLNGNGSTIATPEPATFASLAIAAVMSLGFARRRFMKS